MLYEYGICLLYTSILGLNLDLIEAISLGHDIGHTPFGHAGEKMLNDLYHARTGRYFNHNVHSVRVLDKIVPYNLSLQTLSGIIAHNGEIEKERYMPKSIADFEDFDAEVERCYTDAAHLKELTPCTLEGCVMRICDIIAYLGKDRQDAVRAKLIESEDIFTETVLGRYNAEIINNLTVNIIENSYGHNYLRISPDYYEALKLCKSENYELIYNNKIIADKYDLVISPMIELMYVELLHMLSSGNRNSVIFDHHIDFVNKKAAHYTDSEDYIQQPPDQIVVDYIASMTDDYFIELFKYLFPSSTYDIKYISYFNKDNNRMLYDR